MLFALIVALHKEKESSLGSIFTFVSIETLYAL